MLSNRTAKLTFRAASNNDKGLLHLKIKQEKEILAFLKAESAKTVMEQLNALR